MKDVFYYTFIDVEISAIVFVKYFERNISDEIKYIKEKI